MYYVEDNAWLYFESGYGIIKTKAYGNTEKEKQWGRRYETETLCNEKSLAAGIVRFDFVWVRGAVCRSGRKRGDPAGEAHRTGTAGDDGRDKIYPAGGI